MRTYSMDDLECLRASLDRCSVSIAGGHCTWVLTASRRPYRLTRIVYIQCDRVGSLEFIESSVGSGRFLFTEACSSDGAGGAPGIDAVVEYANLKS